MLKKIEEVLKNERNVLVYIAEELEIEFNEDDSTKDIYKKIIEFELKGKTGFDCGWTHLSAPIYPHNTSFIDTLKQLNAENQSDYVFPSSYYKIHNMEKIDSMQFNLKEFRLEVQSTRIKSLIARYVFEELNLDWRIVNILD